MTVEGSDAELASRVLSYLKRVNGKGSKPSRKEAETASVALALLTNSYPDILTSANKAVAILIELARSRSNQDKAVASMSPGTRSMYDKLRADDPKQARAFLIQEMMANLKLMGELLSNVSKTRSEISMTFARNARG